MKLVLAFISLILLPGLSLADATKGKEHFDKLCVSCHGATGAGDGPAGAALPESMKPRNLQTAQMKYATDDEKFKELLKKGGASVGLSPLMAPMAALSDQDLSDVIAYVKSLKK